MLARVTKTSVTIERADDCAHLHVETALEPADLDAALRADDLGWHVADRAELDVDALHTRAGAQATTLDWESRWAAMIDYAGTRGWLSADGRTVRAHVETVRAHVETVRAHVETVPASVETAPAQGERTR